jgi:hypothetical protein
VIAAKKLGDASANTHITSLAKERTTAKKDKVTSSYFFGTHKPA